MIERYTLPEMGRVWSTENKLDAWLKVEMLVCEAWAELGHIPREALPAIRAARYNIQRMEEIEKVVDHDVIAFLTSITEQMGPEGRYLHLGLTSSDVVDTGLSVQLVQATDLLLRKIDRLSAVLERLAREHKDTVMIGRTHGVHAEPTTFGLKCLLWLEEMRRNRERLELARRHIAVGKISGAVGTHANVPPFVEEYVCEKLGLAVAPVSSQILQRDRHAFYLCTLAVIAATLEKIATEIRSLQRTEVLEAQEPFEAGRKGSSAMPHKRNPSRAERICGLARVVRGYAMTGLENVALWHERDISHSSAERIILPDACILLDYMLHLLTGILDGLVVNPERMRRNLDLTGGLIYSERVLLALVEKGMRREDAYAIAQGYAARVWDEGCSLLDLLKGDPQVRALLTPEELEALFDYRPHLKHLDELYARVLGNGDST
jgi:adenylosuccinate lyase